MTGDGVMSQHLKVCEFNQEKDKVIRTGKFKVMEHIGKVTLMEHIGKVIQHTYILIASLQARNIKFLKWNRERKQPNLMKLTCSEKTSNSL